MCVDYLTPEKKRAKEKVTDLLSTEFLSRLDWVGVTDRRPRDRN